MDKKQQKGQNEKNQIQEHQERQKSTNGHYPQNILNTPLP